MTISTKFQSKDNLDSFDYYGYQSYCFFYGNQSNSCCDVSVSTNDKCHSLVSKMVQQNYTALHYFKDNFNLQRNSSLMGNSNPLQESTSLNTDP